MWYHIKSYKIAMMQFKQRRSFLRTISVPGKLFLLRPFIKMDTMQISGEEEGYMEYAKFIVAGEDKKTLGQVKNTLSACGHIFAGYSKDSAGILRFVRSLTPDMVIIDAGSSFSSIKPVIEIIDEELLCACILLLDSRSDEIFDFLSKTRTVTYIAKPVFNEVVQQIADISLANLRRIFEYEDQVKKLNNTLESRKAVEKAKWILVEQDGLAESEAYNIIRKKSRDNRMPMRDIAEAIILTRGNG